MDIERLKGRINFSTPFIKFFLCVSILWLCSCFALLFPFARDLIIKLGEALVHHALSHQLWHERFLSIGVSGFFLYFLFSFTFFFDTNIFSPKTVKKIAISLLIVISAFFVFVIMYKANWVFGDDKDYVITTAVNKMYQPVFIGGRFFPLGRIHYNLLLLIFRCLGLNTGLPVEAHFLMVAMFCVMSVICLYVLFNKIEPLPNSSHPLLSLFFVCTFFLFGSAFSTIYLYIIFPETPGILLFSIFMLMYYKALKTDKIKYYLVAFIVAAYNTYCKEPIFGIFFVIALTNLIFRYKDASKRERFFYFSLIANGVLFIVLYYFLSFLNSVVFYNSILSGETVGRFQLFLSILKETPVIVIMFTFGFVRLFFVLFRKDREHLYYDSLLFAGMAYVLAFIILRLEFSYYFMPSILLFLPSVVYWLKYVYDKKFTLALCLFFCLMPFFIYNYGHTVGNVKYAWQHRQVFMPYISELLSEYNNGYKFIIYQSDSEITENSFVAVRYDYSKYVLNAFLNYQNKSEGKDFFMIMNPQDHIDMEQDILFFYIPDNDQPMQDEFVNLLQNHNYVFYKDYGGAFIFKRPYNDAVNDFTPQPMGGKTAFEYFRDENILVGWNLGNTLDSYRNGIGDELIWGNPSVSQTLMDGVKAQGFDLIRIPITWMGHIGPAPEHKIAEARLKRVAEIVEMAHNAGLKVIINLHHDGSTSNEQSEEGWLSINRARKSKDGYDEVTHKFRRVWEQIALYFKNYGDWLMFEPFNELHDGGWAWSQDFRTNPDPQLEIINNWNQIFTDAVRQSGGNNATRYLVIPGYCTNPQQTLSPKFHLPNDSASFRQVVSFHYYDPYEFGIASTRSEWGSQADKQKTDDDFRPFKAQFIDKNIPVIIGECGAVLQLYADKAKEEAAQQNRREYLPHIYGTARKYGIVPVYWDNGLNSGGGEKFGLIDRRTGLPNSGESELLLRSMLAAVRN
jgi:endoglucanase